jgi:Fur family transcriptional regulator, ferric uptake regulator
VSAVDVHSTVGERLRSVGQRYTSGRRAVVDVLLGSGQPLTIPQILERRATIPQSSLYRNLAVLEQAGAVRRIVTTGDFARYELAEDLTEHHHHLICSACGDVADVALPPHVDRRLVQALEDIADAAGFRPEAHRVDLVGRCALCAASA